MCKSQPTYDKLSMIWAWSGRVIHYEIVGLQIDMIGASNHVTGTAEPKVVKFCTRVGYMNSCKLSTTKGRGYDHVTVTKICRMP